MGWLVLRIGAPSVDEPESRDLSSEVGLGTIPSGAASPSEGLGRQRIRGNVFPAAEGGDPGITLRVTVSDELGERLDRGIVRCFWGTDLQPEIGAGEVVEQDLNPDGTPCEFSLPAGILAVVVQAVIPGRAPAQESIRDVYFVDGKWVDPSQGVTWELHLVCTRETPEGFLGGRILVDGRAAVPDDLEIRLLQEPPSFPVSHREWCRQGDRRGILDGQNARYWVGPVTKRARGLWVTSAEVEPLWIPGPELYGRTEMDLRLASGASAHLRLVDQSAGTAIPGVTVTWEVEAAIASSQNRVSYRGFTRNTRTDANGECSIRGVKPDTHLRVECLDIDGTQRKLVASYGRDWPLDAVREIPVPWSAASGAWGRWPEIAEAAPECRAAGGVRPPAILALESADGAQKTLRRDGDELAEWHLDLAPGTWTAELRRGRIPVTQPVRFEVPENGEAGPIQLAPREPHLFDFRWSGASPAANTSLRLFTDDGALLAAEKLSLSSTDGNCRLSVPGLPARVEVTLQYADGTLLDLRQTVQPSGVWFEFPAGEPVPLSFLLNGESPQRDGRLVVYSLNGEMAAGVPLDGGEGHLPVLPRGRFYYAYVGGSESGIVAGIGTPSDPLRIEWRGRKLQRSEWSDCLSASYRLSSVDGTCLEGIVPEGIRLFQPLALEKDDFWWGEHYAPALKK